MRVKKDAMKLQALLSRAKTMFLLHLPVGAHVSHKATQSALEIQPQAYLT